MPGLKDTRAAIVGRANAHWAAAYPDVPIFYDNNSPGNQQVDQLTHYVLCSIRFTGSSQINIANNPDHRHTGVIVFTALCREGTGSSDVLDYLDSLAGAMKFATFGGVTTSQPIPGKPLNKDGWFSYDLMIPFRVDSTN